MKKLLSALLCLSVLASGLFMPAAALAQAANSSQGLNIEISPLPIELDAKPGTTIATDLRVRNSGSTPEVLRASLKTFTAEGPDGHVVLHDPTPADNFINWVSFDKTFFTAAPGQWQTIRMTINVPKTAAFGYYYAAQFQLANPPKPQPGAARLQGAVAIFVLLNAEASGASRKIQVTSFKADHSDYEFLPVNFSIQVRNTGNVHTAPHGNIFIKRGSHQVASITVNSTEGMVLPKSNRIFNADWSNGFPVYTGLTDSSGQPIKNSRGQAERHLNWDFSKISHLRFGHYTAQLLLVYNDGQRDVPITGTLSFWVIPWRILAGLIIVLVFMTIGFWSTFRRAGGFVKRKAKRPRYHV